MIVILLTGLEEIKLLQELLSNFWPARYQYLVNGWVLRVTDGETGRANSVLPNFYCGKSVEDDIASVEKIYKKFSFRTEFQVADHAEPENLGEILISKGYIEHDKTNVMIGQVNNWVDLDSNRNYRYYDSTNESDKWFNIASILSKSSEKRNKEKKDIVNRIIIPEKALMMAVDAKNNVIGVVLGVMDEKHLCVFDLVVHPLHRNQGVATSLMVHTASWAMNKGASKVFLHVVDTNKAASKLYSKMGLITSFSYRYYRKTD